MTVVNITLIHYIVKSTPNVLKLYKEKNIKEKGNGKVKNIKIYIYKHKITEKKTRYGVHECYSNK